MKRSTLIRLGILAILAFVALFTHILPLSLSPWPFNNDGITECSIANDIMNSGSLDYPADRFYTGSHSVITPSYNILIAFVSSAIGSSPFSIAQMMVAAISLTTIVGGYVIALRISHSVKGGIATALTMSLFGTFVFLTGSAWKESLGVALLVLLVYVYINRTEKRMLILEIIILISLPIVHHLVAGIAYLSIWFLTIWSLAYARKGAGIRRRHLVDTSIISLVSLSALWYYSQTSHDRLNLVASDYSFMVMGLVLAGFGVSAFAVLMRKRHSRFSIAPFISIAVFAVVLMDYLDPLFPYAQGYPPWSVLLAGAASILVGIGWFGLETLVKQRSELRAVPIGFLLPVLAILTFSLIAETGIMSHWIIYRTFDFADVPLALGVAAAFAYFGARPRTERIMVVTLLTILLISFPFAYFTGPLEGIRHDTQDYEVDATTWVSVHVGTQVLLQTDERLAYNARALYDFIKAPNLPSTLVNYEIPIPTDYNLLLEEWYSVGVNDYPNGHPVLDEVYCRTVIEASDVLYVGGPTDNSAIVFSTSTIGMSEIFD